MEAWKSFVDENTSKIWWSTSTELIEYMVWSFTIGKLNHSWLVKANRIVSEFSDDNNLISKLKHRIQKKFTFSSRTVRNQHGRCKFWQMEKGGKRVKSIPKMEISLNWKTRIFFLFNLITLTSLNFGTTYFA